MIKHPMDFGTIKKKLNLNIYKEVEEFLKDMSLVFSNCQLYNGTETPVGRIGVQVRSEYVRLLGQYNFVERFQNSQQVHPSELFIQNLQRSKKENKENQIEEEAQGSPVGSGNQAVQPIEEEKTQGGLEKIDEVRSTLERKGSENFTNKEKTDGQIETQQVLTKQKKDPVLSKAQTPVVVESKEANISKPVNQNPVENQEQQKKVNEENLKEKTNSADQQYQQPKPIPQVNQNVAENLKTQKEESKITTQGNLQVQNQTATEANKEIVPPVKSEQETMAKPIESEDSLMGAGTEGNLVGQTETAG